MNSTNSLPNFKTNEDSRGKLLPVDFSKLPFVPKRMFLTFGVPDGQVRGKHASKVNRQILFCTGGEIHAVFVRRGVSERKILKRGDYYFVDNMTWNELTFYNQASLVSLCSEEYDPLDYITDYQEFSRHA